MLPDRVLKPGPLTYESGALPIALRGPGLINKAVLNKHSQQLPYNTRFISEYQGPVVQSIVSLMSSLRGQLVQCFTT